MTEALGVRIWVTARENRCRAVGWVMGSLSSASLLSLSDGTFDDSVVWEEEGRSVVDDGCKRISVASSSVSVVVADDGEVDSDKGLGRIVSSAACGGRLSSGCGGVGGLEDDRRVWTARKAWCEPVKGADTC